MEKLELVPSKPNKESMLTPEETQELADLTKQINEISLQASKITQKMSAPEMSSIDILALEEEKASLHNKSRALSDKRIKILEKYDGKKV